MSSNQESASSKETNQSVTLKSSDDHLFTLTITEAAMSEKIKDLIKDCPSSPSSSSSGSVIPLDNIDGEVLERVTTFMKKHAVENLSVFDKMKFNEEFLSGMDVYEHLDLAMGAYGLKVNYLVDATCQKIADHIKNKSVEYVRKLFNIENDFTPEEEEKIRRENAWVFEEGVDDDDE